MEVIDRLGLAVFSVFLSFFCEYLSAVLYGGLLTRVGWFIYVVNCVLTNAPAHLQR